MGDIITVDRNFDKYLLNILGVKRGDTINVTKVGDMVLLKRSSLSDKEFIEIHKRVVRAMKKSGITEEEVMRICEEVRKAR